MKQNFDPPADPFGNEVETHDANGEWYCPKCGRTRRTYRGRDYYDYQSCAVDGKPMIWKPDEHPENSTWCGLCEFWVEPKDFVLWSGDDMQHWLCPGCDSDMCAPQDLE